MLWRTIERATSTEQAPSKRLESSAGASKSHDLPVSLLASRKTGLHPSLIGLVAGALAVAVPLAPGRAAALFLRFLTKTGVPLLAL